LKKVVDNGDFQYGRQNVRRAISATLSRYIVELGET